MAPPSYSRAKELFNSALLRPLEERDAFLDEACGADRELLREVKAQSAPSSG